MFSGKISRNAAGLYTDKGLIYPGMLWALEGKAWDAATSKMRAILPYATVIYVAHNGDLWYYAPQNNVSMPVVRIADRQRIYGIMASLGIDVLETDHNS